MVRCRLNIVKRVRNAFGTFQGRTTKNKLSRRSALNSNIIQTKKERKNKIQVFVYRTWFWSFKEIESRKFCALAAVNKSRSVTIGTVTVFYLQVCLGVLCRKTLEVLQDSEWELNSWRMLATLHPLGPLEEALLKGVVLEVYSQRTRMCLTLEWSSEMSQWMWPMLKNKRIRSGMQGKLVWTLQRTSFAKTPMLLPFSRLTCRIDLKLICSLQIF